MICLNKITLIGVALLGWSIACGQQATEIYIPIGKSPGISGTDSVIGSISSVDRTGYRMTIAADGETKTVTMTPSTRYYIDRHKHKQSNVTGSFEDCETGRRVEVLVDDDSNAVWVKIAAP